MTTLYFVSACASSSRRLPCSRSAAHRVPPLWRMTSRGMVYVHSMKNDDVDDPSTDELLEECDEVEAEINVADFESVSVELTEESGNEYVFFFMCNVICWIQCGT